MLVPRSCTFSPNGPQRALILSSLVNRIGKGMFSNSLIIYLTLVVRLPPSSVGISLTVAGLVGLMANIPAGDLADRRGPRVVLLVSLTVQIVTMLAFIFVRDTQTFILIAVVDRVAIAANGAAAGALIGRVGGDHSAPFRARLRTFTNLGVVVGTLGAGIAAESCTRLAFTVLIVASAASLAGCGFLLLRVPDYQPLPAPDERRYWAALADRPFAWFVVLESGMGLQYQVVSLLLPIWISQHTHAPRWTAAACFAVNAVVCILLQTRIGGSVVTLGQGGRAFKRAGLYFLLSCSLLAAAADLGAWQATALVLLAIAVHSLGEVLESSATFVLAFGLAPDHAQGQYQGLFGLGFDAGQALAPVLLTAVCGGLAQIGWVLIGGFLTGLGAAGPSLARWAERSRTVKRSGRPSMPSSVALDTPRS